MLCTPSNPTGAVYSAGELSALAGVLLRHPEVNVISDDLYEHIIFDGAEFATLAAVAPDLRDRILTVNGVSKSYSMTGWRIGLPAARNGGQTGSAVCSARPTAGPVRSVRLRLSLH